MLYSPKLCWILLSKAASYWASMHTSELLCTLWATLPLPELCCTLLSYVTFYKLQCTIVSYAASYWSICCTLLNYSLPSGAMLSCTLLSYPTFFWATLHPHSWAVPCRAMLNPAQLHWLLLSNAAPCWALLHPCEPELLCTLWATLYPKELGCTLVSCAITFWTKLQLLSYWTVTKLPPFVQLFWMPRCRTDRHPVSLVPERKIIMMPEPFRYWNKETQSGTGILWYWTEMIDAGIPMPAASALMLMPSYG